MRVMMLMYELFRTGRHGPRPCNSRGVLAHHRLRMRRALFLFCVLSALITYFPVYNTLWFVSFSESFWTFCRNCTETVLLTTLLCQTADKNWHSVCHVMCDRLVVTDKKNLQKTSYNHTFAVNLTANEPSND